MPRPCKGCSARPPSRSSSTSPAQAGVRYSLINPHRYVRSNLVGFVNILEACRRHARRAPGLRLVELGLRRQYARCRSRCTRHVDHPVSLYARDQEGQRADGAQLQPPVRPADHGPALLHRLRALGPPRHGALPVHQGDPGAASRSRSSTTAGWSATSPTSTTSSRACVRLADTARRAEPGLGRPDARPRVEPRALAHLQHRQQRPGRRCCRLIELLETQPRPAGRSSGCCRCNPATCPPTYADIDDLVPAIGFRPTTTIEEGLSRFCAWFRHYHGP